MNKTARKFEGILDRYFEKLLEDSPIYATVQGIRAAEGELDRSDLESERISQRQRLFALGELDSISPRELSADQQLDRLALRSMLLAECEDFARGRHAIEPDAPEALLNILFHELMRGADEPRRAARNLRSLLNKSPRFLQQSTTLLRKPERVWLRVMEQAVDGSRDLLDGIAQFLQKVRPNPQDAASLRATERALHRYRDKASALAPAPAGSFAIGKEQLQRRLRDELGLDYTLGQVEALALSEIARVNGLLRAGCHRFGNRSGSAEILAAARAQWRPARPLLELYQKATADIANGFRCARAVSFPNDDQLAIKPVPEFLRTLIPTAAYSQPGAFERRQRGVFWVNDLSVLRKTATAKLAEQQQHFGLTLTCAHEAYPGHHLQFVMANRHPRKWRRLFAHAVFYEGWTLWCEQMTVDLRIDRSPWTQLQQLHDALWRCHRILVDLRLQCGRYGYEQGVHHLQKHLGFTRARAEADVNWYTAAPGVPMSYWLGRLENERLHARLVNGRKWSLRKFNDWLLSFGTIPQSWIEKYGLT